MKNVDTDTQSFNSLDFVREKAAEFKARGKDFPSFNDFLLDWPDVDMTDPRVVSEQMEQQVNILNKLSYYLLIQCRRDDYPLAFKAQRMMRESLSYILPSDDDHDDTPRAPKK